MKSVVFARDRRRRKNRIKLFITLVIFFPLVIGGIGYLKLQNTNTANLQQLVLEDGKIAANIEPLITVDSPINNAPQQNLQIETGHFSIPLTYDPEIIYIDIQDNELEEVSSPQPVDETATSYEDDFVVEDDLDDETIQKLQTEASKKDEESSSIGIEREPIQTKFSYTVIEGDKLQNVLEQSGLNETTAKILENKFPQLMNLKAGQQFDWQVTPEGELIHMTWFVSEKEEKIFERISKNQFTVKTLQKKGVWQQDIIKGHIDGSFSTSLKVQGLSDRQINQLSAALQWQVSMSRLQKGDKFAILVKREYINGKVTELGNVEAIHLFTGKKSYYAIQADNGQYYNRNGETLGKGFARYPLQSRARISSHFNPKRRHPVTKRIAPHKGVDFAVPIGTPIIAPADGTVIHVAYQANGAGRYIKIRHSGQYTTVYMHLSRALVKPGQAVKKGERIALSGNTGRSTGPHLHYEFHINGHPVNPMTVKLPGTGSSMPEKERKAFLTKARAIEAKLKL